VDQCFFYPLSCGDYGRYKCRKIWGDSGRYKSRKIWGGGLRGHTCPFTTNSERELKGGFGNGASLSMGALLGEPGGGTPFLVALSVIEGRLWRQEPFFMGAQLGDLEWVHLPGL